MENEPEKIKFSEEAMSLIAEGIADADAGRVVDSSEVLDVVRARTGAWLAAAPDRSA